MWHAHWQVPGLIAVARVLEPGHSHYQDQEKQRQQRQQLRQE
jgi:hypothetical protein